MVKAPKIYIRDSGILHYLLGITQERHLHESPQRGNSWEGYLIEQIVSLEQLRRSGSQFFFYRTHAGAEMDLVIDRGRERSGFEFKCATSVTPRDWGTLQQSLVEGMIGSLIKPLIPRRLQLALRRRMVLRKVPQVRHIWPIDPAGGKKPEGWPGWPHVKQFAPNQLTFLSFFATKYCTSIVHKKEV